MYDRLGAVGLALLCTLLLAACGGGGGGGGGGCTEHIHESW